MTKILTCVCFLGFCSPISSQSSTKGVLNLHLSLPHINTFYLQPENEPDKKVRAGFWGLSIGMDYHYSDNQFLILSASGVTDIIIPFPAALDYSGEYETANSVYLSLSNNHNFNRFTLGYGVSFGVNSWAVRFDDRFDPPPPTREPVTKTSSFLGLVFPSYYKWSERFHIGLIYRPTLLRLNIEPQIKYEHLISIDFAWKIRL